MTGNVYKNVEATQVKLKPKFFQHLLKYDSSIYEIWNYNPSSNNALDVKSSNIRTLLAPFLASSIYDVEQERTTWAKVEKVQQGIRVQVFDKSKFFAFDEGTKLYSLESYNNGKTWANLRDLGFQLSLEDGKKLGNYFGGLISGSGNGIELQHQSDNNKKTNGRILFTVYWWTWSDPNNSSSVQKQEGIWIYSDDQGQSWPRLAKDPIKDDTFESTFI
ncbi:sialidase family protein [Mesomycoplasma hyorhinis]|uniref:sialidase family protein n=1 Tax=Mesomycoplasma hyorhinis TaxID=2100 RepID=UPI001C05B318|nr:sialidase family protein [Mesomycoplasma hyorhinis]